MPTPDYALTMARYNLWQNENLVSAVSLLSQGERQKDRGAFFGSIEKTFSHIYWADQIWLGRFAETPLPGGGIKDSVELITRWDAFVVQRAAFDHRILAWAKGVEAEWFAGDLVWYSGAMAKHMSKSKTLLCVHFFNHQTHHRGQIHSMLTAAGVKPGASDLAFMPEPFLEM